LAWDSPFTILDEMSDDFIPWATHFFRETVLDCGSGGRLGMMGRICATDGCGRVQQKIYATGVWDECCGQDRGRTFLIVICCG
jgi:hypothetical protein